jgi:hypothetical protein
MDGVPNPFYDPQWVWREATSAAAYAQAERFCAREAAAGFGSLAHRAAVDRLAQAKDALKHARRARFKTIADYAVWLFSTLPPGPEGFSVVPDTAAFTAIDEVDAAFARAKQHRREAARAESLLLPTRQPTGLAAFADAVAVISSWRRLGPEATAIDCLVSFHETGGEFHICLAHPWGGLARHANEVFQRSATQLAREIISFAVPGAAEIFLHDRHQLVQYRETIRAINNVAARLRFYRHLQPQHDLREEFSRVEMGWDGAKCVDPDWSFELFSSLPYALREASAAANAPRLRYLQPT